MDNGELAARIGINHIEMMRSADVIARNILWVVNNAEKRAIKKVSSYDDIHANLTIVYNEIASLVMKKSYSKLAEYTKKLSYILSNAIFNIDIEEGRKQLVRSVFPGIKGSDIIKIIQTQNISARLATSMSRSGLSPNQVAQAAIARSEEALKRSMVSQYFARLRNIAYTIGRTSVAKMAGDAGKAVYESLPRNLVGFQVHGILDDRIRPAHRERNGTIYYKTPRYGNKGFDEMPNPPTEADGTTAFNCRCWLSPVVAQDTDKFYDFKGRIIPNARIFNEWFSAANKPMQLLAIGAKRYQAAARRLKKGERLQWFHLLDPDSGMLLDPKEIAAESVQKRTARIKKAKNLIFKT